MSTQRYARIAVIDIGKTNAKVVVLDGVAGTEIAVRKTPNRVVDAAPYPHYDIGSLWSFILSSLGDFAKAPGYDAISITTHGASAALLDAHGDLALPVLDYEFEYPQGVRQAYDRLRPDFSQTGSPRLAAGLNLGAQLHFQKTVFPDLFGRVATILTYPQYWAFLLTGAPANEVTSLGCHTDLWLPRDGHFSALVDRLDLEPMMAPVRPAFDALGLVLPEIANRIGLSASVPVYCGIHDSNASLLPHLVAQEAPFCVVSTGTWVVTFAVGAETRDLDPRFDVLINVDAMGRPVPSSRFMGGRLFEKLTADLPPSSEIEEEQALRRVIAKGLLLAPDQARLDDESGRPAETVEDPHERRVIASLHEALMTEFSLALVGAAGPVIVEGPFSANGLYLSSLAQRLGRPVHGSSAATGTALGAAMLAGVRPASTLRPAAPLLLDLDRYAARWRGIFLPILQP